VLGRVFLQSGEEREGGERFKVQINLCQRAVERELKKARGLSDREVRRLETLTATTQCSGREAIDEKNNKREKKERAQDKPAER